MIGRHELLYGTGYAEQRWSGHLVQAMGMK
jgi:hypothetical protein